ncbi:MAG: DUF4189 domain-containing protein [Alphaproteobacteria bacterium]
MLWKIALVVPVVALGSVGAARAEFGAIAFGNGKSSKVFGQPSQQKARMQARSKCGQHCRAIVFGSGKCAAFAVSGNGVQFPGTGTSLNDAENAAMGACNAKASLRGNCRIGVSACQ